MGFAWGHTTYAVWKGIVFNFEDKWDLDYFLAHAKGSKRLTFNQAWELNKEHIKIFSSRSLGANSDRKQRVKEWKNAIKC